MNFDVGKSCTCCPNWREVRGGCNLDKIQKNSSIFSRCLPLVSYPFLQSHTQIYRIIKVVARYANNQTSWSLHVEDVQATRIFWLSSILVSIDKAIMKDIDKKSLKNIHDQSKPNNHSSSRWKYAEWWKLSWLADL